MWQFFILSLLHLVYAKENFQYAAIGNTSLDVARSRCFQDNRCNQATGCCHGHGVCQAAANYSQCACFAVQDCYNNGHYNYTGSDCSIAKIGNISDNGCCVGSTYDYIFAQSGVCNQRATTDPELGSKGRLGVHIGSPSYGPGYTNKWSDASIATMIADLTNSSRHNYSTNGFTMLGLGFLEVSIKDMVDWALDTTTFTINGKTYYNLKKQVSTGCSWGSTNVTKKYENIATSIIDVGPLYDHSTRKNSSFNNTVSPYLASDAATYWDTVHHMSVEFTTVVQLYCEYHNYVARNLELYFCGQDSSVTDFSRNSATCTNYYRGNSQQGYINWIFEQARRSTIRFSQMVLEQSTLQLLTQTETYDVNDPLTEQYFDMFFRRDQPHWCIQASTFTYDSVRSHQEFKDFATQTDLSMHHVSGIDFFVSMRNPSLNVNAATYLGTSACGVPISSFANKVVNLANTPTRTFGSLVDPMFADELTAIFHRINELGLSDYKTHVEALTNITSTGLASGVHVYYGATTEKNASYMFAGKMSSVALAAAVVANDVIIKDRTNYFGMNMATGDWTGQNFHPEFDVATWDECFSVIDPGTGLPTCTTASTNAAPVVTSYNPYFEMSSVPAYGTRGAGLAQPYWIQTSSQAAATSGDITIRLYSQGTAFGELENALFYQYDGLNSIAFHMSDSTDSLLQNPIVDSIHYSLGWKGVMDGVCYTTDVLANYCDRADSFIWGNACPWSWV